MSRSDTRKHIAGLAAWLLVAFTAAAIGGLASAGAGTFYEQLAQPVWAPPGWVFGPVWTLLYALMGIAAWLVWRSGGFRANAAALGSFIGQLALNALWSWLFFEWRLGAWSFADILLLIAALSITLILFWRVRPVAGALLIPYLLWVLFAAVLNYSVWRMNPQLLG